MAKVILENLEKKYENGYYAVKKANLTIEDKEFVVLVGPSGCGKSTTIRMIAGLETITGGTLKIDDVVVNDVKPKDRDIAMVFQNYALYPHMTVAENIAFSLKIAKINKDEINKKVLEVAKILQLENLLDRKPKALSGGQRQRVALGRAIIRKPKVFLMDEPLSNLDAKLRTEMRTSILKLHKKLQATFVYVTHDQVEAMTMGDRIVVMKEGEILQVDTPKNIYANPNNKFVAEFIGTPKINILEAIIEEQNENIVAKLKNTEDVFIIPEGKSKILKEKGYLNKEILLGVRSENIHVENIFLEAHKENIFKAQVEITELMGAEINVHMNYNDTKIIAKFNARDEGKEGDIIDIALDMNRVLFFDKETERNIFNN